MQKDISVILHMPEAPEARESLQASMDRIHADAIISYLRRLECSIEQKLALLDEVREKSKADREC